MNKKKTFWQVRAYEKCDFHEEHWKNKDVNNIDIMRKHISIFAQTFHVAARRAKQEKM